MIVIVCVAHKMSWVLYSEAENDSELEGIEGHFSRREVGLFGSECDARVLTVGESQESSANSRSESKTS